MIDDVFWVKKQIVSSTLSTTVHLPITQPCRNGDAFIEDVVLLTDGTGLAGGTNFTLNIHDGTTPILFGSWAISGLGANKISDLERGATKFRTVLRPGSYVTALNTVAAGTGAGVLTICLKCRRIKPGTIVNKVP